MSVPSSRVLVAKRSAGRQRSERQGHIDDLELRKAESLRCKDYSAAGHYQDLIDQAKKESGITTTGTAVPVKVIQSKK